VGLCEPLPQTPLPLGGSIQRSLRPIAVFKGPTSNGRERYREGEEGGEWERKGRGRNGKGGTEEKNGEWVCRTNGKLLSINESIGLVYFTNKPISKIDRKRGNY